MRGSPDFLFAQADWFSVAENQKAGMTKEILGLPENQILTRQSMIFVPTSLRNTVSKRLNSTKNLFTPISGIHK